MAIPKTLEELGFQPKGKEKLTLASFGIEKSVAPPPIITTTKAPKVGTSQIDAGKSAIQELSGLGVSSDINTIRTNWSKFGLNTKLGDWIGSSVQWNAYAKYAKDELERIKTGLETAQKTLTAGQEKVVAEGITPPITPPTEPITPITPTTPLTPETLNTVQLSSTDIGDIMKEFETDGTPETVIAGEVAKLLTADEIARTSQVLTQFQQQMAKSGMAFSSIRSSGEAAIAAESLSRQSGINLDLATKIVNAARTEQTNRLNAIQAQQTASTAALKSMGYVLDPVSGTLMKTLERERFEAPAEPKIQNVGGDLVSIDPTTGAISMLFKGEPNYKYFTDDVGNVTEYNPETGEIADIGKIGKGFKPTTTTLEPLAYTGKYSESFLATRAGDFVSDAGEIDWEMVDDLENTDKDLWNDMTMFFSDYLKNLQEIEETSTLEQPTPEATGFLKSIGEVGKLLFETNPFTAPLKWLFGD